MMFTFKVITTVFIALMMCMFVGIWISSKEEREYYWIWVVMEIVYVFSLICMWG